MAAIRSLEGLQPQLQERLRVRQWPVRRVLMGTLVMLILSTTAVAAAFGYRQLVPGPPVDIFDQYAAIMPEQPLEGLADYPCTSLYSPYPSDWEQNHGGALISCQKAPRSGPISYIGITANDSEIRSVAFRITGLSAGDLIEKWGPPDMIRKYPKSFTLAWNDGMYVTGLVQGRFSHWSAVHFVMFTPRYSM